MLIEIECWSDPICPWCFIGMKGLEQAIYLYKRTYYSTDTFKITHRAYFLSPDGPEIGVGMLQRIGEKNGEKRVSAITSRLSRAGQQVGITFNFEGKIGNTIKAHQIIKLAQSQSHEAGEMVVRQLFEQLWEQKSDITDRKMLFSTGRAAGLLQNQMDDCLANGEFQKEALADFQQAKALGFDGVPALRLQKKVLLKNGADDPSEFMQQLVDLKEAKLKEAGVWQ